MIRENSEIAAAISQKYRALHQAFAELNSEAAHFHADMLIRDNSSRGTFNSLSRILALSDQLHMTISLMGEDVRALETSNSDPMTALWNEQVEECLDEWLVHASMSNDKVH